MEPIPYFDAHCDTVYRCDRTGEHLFQNSGQVDLHRGRRFFKYGQFFALFHDAREAPPEGMLAVCHRLHDRFLKEMADNSDAILQCRTTRDVQMAVKAGKAAAVLSIEGADLLDCDPGRVAMAGAWGVRFCNPTWNRANVLCGTNCENTDRGLSAQGRDFIRAMEHCGICADMSHLSEKGFWDVFDMAEKPIVASHSNAKTLCDHRRNLTDEQFKAIRDSGGVVGWNFYTPFVGLSGDVEALAEHAEHFLSLGGEKTLCIGGDLDGSDGEWCGLRGLEDISLLYKALAKRHYGKELLYDIFWGNLERLLG
ncbi:MAG: membrane dipeptidase [Clostridiales bacterium]|nr:membrane dipeptidase [Clostridiales bacterium]